MRRAVANLLGRLVAGAIVGLATLPLGAQEVRRLPPIDARSIGPDDSYPGQLASFPEQRIDFSQPPPSGLPAPDEPSVESPAQEEVPPGTRPGVFQKLTPEATWIVGGSGPSDIAQTDLEIKSVFGLPCPTRKSPLVITPGFAIHLLDGPTIADLPPAVYDAYTQLRWLSRLTPRLGLDLAVTPGWYSDYHQNSAEALRVTGYGAAMYTWNPNTNLVLGAAYLDRPDTNVMPIGGILWEPDADTSFELVFPRPRIARRMPWGRPGTPVKHWLYVAGELGGGTWVVRRADGSNDVLNSRDYRVLLGWEWKTQGTFSARLEAGYVFGRKYEYENSPISIRPSDALMLRAGMNY